MLQVAGGFQAEVVSARSTGAVLQGRTVEKPRLRGMRDYFGQVARATNGGLYYLALAGALVVPDMCAAMEAEDGRATPARYIDWFDRHVAPKYEGVITGEDSWGLRCSMLHQGRLRPHRGSYARVLFVEPVREPVLHRNVINDALNIDVRLFVEDLLTGALAWLHDAEKTDVYQRNYEVSMKRHPNGLAPYIGGAPVIG